MGEGISFRGGLATRTCRIKSMPRYLLVQIQRYTIDEKWMPTKLDCRVPMPDTLNLEQFRGRGIQPGEKELPEESAEPPQSSPEADELQVAQLVSMDISQNAAKRACSQCRTQDPTWLLLGTLNTWGTATST